MRLLKALIMGTAIMMMSQAATAVDICTKTGNVITCDNSTTGYTDYRIGRLRHPEKVAIVVCANISGTWTQVGIESYAETDTWMDVIGCNAGETVEVVLNTATLMDCDEGESSEVMGIPADWFEDGYEIDTGEGEDRIIGSDHSYEWLCGGSQTDRIMGNAGDDNLYGGDGVDYIWGGDGDDSICGGNGDDFLYGDDGDDDIMGEDGNDTIEGNADDDNIWGGDDSDIIEGNAGDDTIEGGAGIDYIWGGDDADEISGDAGDDELHGGRGDDMLTGGTGTDSCWGDTDWDGCVCDWEDPLTCNY